MKAAPQDSRARVDKSVIDSALFIVILASPFVVIGCLKGRYVLSVVGMFLLFGIPAILAATRLARTDSWWAKRFYDEDKLSQAAHRFPGNSRINDAFTL